MWFFDYFKPWARESFKYDKLWSIRDEIKTENIWWAKRRALGFVYEDRWFGVEV